MKIENFNTKILLSLCCNKNPLIYSNAIWLIYQMRKDNFDISFWKELYPILISIFYNDCFKMRLFAFKLLFRCSANGIEIDEAVSKEMLSFGKDLQDT